MSDASETGAGFLVPIFGADFWSRVSWVLEEVRPCHSAPVSTALVEGVGTDRVQACCDAVTIKY